jgi:DNA-binding NarL/FixJ family response regulator
MDSQSQLPVRVFLADDHPVVLAGMKAMIVADTGLELVGEARDGRTALRQALALRPDVAVLDLSMPGLNGVEVARQLLEAFPQCRVLVLTVHEDAAYLRQLLETGVGGYVLKRSAPEELIRGIHAVAAGGLYLDPGHRRPRRGPKRAAHTGRRGRHRHHGSQRARSGRAAADRGGHSNKTIAARLLIGVKTVDTYKARAMSQAGVSEPGGGGSLRHEQGVVERSLGGRKQALLFEKRSKNSCAWRSGDRGGAGVLTLYSYPALFGVADNNPYGLKVYAFLRLNRIAFRHEHILDASRAPRGQLPYIDDDGVIVGDSDAIITYLTDRDRLTIDAALTPAQRDTHLLSPPHAG